MKKIPVVDSGGARQMHLYTKRSERVLVALVFGGVASLLTACASVNEPVLRAVASAPEPPRHYATKTLYVAQQAADTYAPAPVGYQAVFTQLVARHGARGLSGPGADLIAYNLFLAAQSRGALTPLGQRFGPDVMRLMRVNALLGYADQGSDAQSAREPGYGNLSARGVNEHRGLAQRLVTRLPALFDPASAESARPATAKLVTVQTSGVDRARDSARNFVDALIASSPRASVNVQTEAKTATEAGAVTGAVGSLSAPGSNRYLLYFHRLNTKQDQLSGPDDSRYATLQQSLAYQKYLSDSVLRARIDGYASEPEVPLVAHALLTRLFSAEFVDAIKRGNIAVHQGGEYVFTSVDGKLTRSVKARASKSDKTLGLVDAASAVYDLYAIAPGLRDELGIDFSDYVLPNHAATFAFLSDAEDFYEKGPAIREDNPITFAMAQGLVADLFDHAETAAKTQSQHIATLRFTHAEIISPLVSALALPEYFTPESRASQYRYETNAWRGENVIPMAANVQWDVYRNDSGHVIARMLFNERETKFKPSCDTARMGSATSGNFYDLAKLRACYAAE